MICLIAVYLSHFTAQEAGKGGLADEEVVIYTQLHEHKHFTLSYIVSKVTQHLACNPFNT
jgi:hypothetical protein